MIFNYKSNLNQYIYLTDKYVGLSLKNIAKYLNKLHY